MVVVVRMVGEPSRTTTTEDPVKMGEVEMAGSRDMVMEVESVWNLDEMGVLSYRRAGFGMLVCVLVLVVVVVLVWMVLTVWILVGTLRVA